MSEITIRNVLVTSGWRTPAQVTNLSNEECRIILTIELSRRVSENLPFLKGLNDTDLSWNILMYLWSKDAEIKTEEELKSISLQELREVIINESNKHVGAPVSELEKMDDEELTRLAYQWWLESELRPLVNSLNSVSNYEEKIFGLKDTSENAMDSLKILDNGDSLIGIYHSYEDVFELKIATATHQNLSIWTKQVSLGSHGHQGDIKKMGEGYVVVNEQDISGQGNHIRVRFYESRQKLMGNEPAKDLNLEWAFSLFAEGTPNIISVNGTEPGESIIAIGFHYLSNDKDVDRQAYGVLKNFDSLSWTAENNELVNSNVEHIGFHGNIGSRYNFDWAGKNLIVMEARIVPGEWDSWRLIVGYNGFFIPLNPITPNNSFAFANPSIVKLNENTYIISSFLPSEGAGANEAGQLIYKVEF